MSFSPPAASQGASVPLEELKDQIKHPGDKNSYYHLMRTHRNTCRLHHKIVQYTFVKFFVNKNFAPRCAGRHNMTPQYFLFLLFNYEKIISGFPRRLQRQRQAADCTMFKVLLVEPRFLLLDVKFFLHNRVRQHPAGYSQSHTCSTISRVSLLPPQT